MPTLSKHTLLQPFLWGILHCLNDFIAGFMLANYTYHHSYSDSFLFIVIYSVLAFGGQLPVGFWMDAQKKIKPFVQATVVLLPLSIIVFLIDPAMGIICSGIASALVHVSGGTICLQVNDGKAGPLAIFTAPGVLGLTLGGLLGAISMQWLWVFLALVIMVEWFILQLATPLYPIRSTKSAQLDGHDWMMMSILLIMCFRSFIFDVINQVSFNFEDGIFIIGISAFVGKIIGGLVADKIGWKKFVYISLPITFLCFQFGKDNMYALSFGIACLQSSVPISFLLMGNSLANYPATASALTLGTSIALAGLPLYLVSDKTTIMDGFANNWLSALFLLLIIVAWWLLDRLFYRPNTDPPL